MKKWRELPVWERNTLILKASLDPVFFSEHPMFLGYNLYPKQAEVLREFYRTDTNYTHLIMAIGMRAGKTFLSANIMAYEVFKLLIIPGSIHEHYGLARGAPIFIVNIAASELQAMDTVWAFFKNNVEESPYFQGQHTKILSSEVRFYEKNLVCRALPATSKSQVGKTSKCVIFDELAKLDETESSKSAHEVYTTLSKATASFGHDARIIAIGSIMHAGDEIMRLVEMAADREKYPWILAYKFPTWEFNPNLPFDPETGKGAPALVEAFHEDPDMFWRDFGCEPSAAVRTWVRDLEPWYDAMRKHPRENVLAELAVMTRNELEYYAKKSEPPENINSHTGYMYVLAGDPALRNDAFGIALSHIEDDYYICDGLWRFKPTKTVELDALHLRAFLIAVCYLYPVQYAVFDTWAFAETMQEIRERGIPVLENVVKREHYERVHELIKDSKLWLPDYPFLIEEIKRLRIISEKKLDRSKHSSKDVSDALCNTIWAMDEIRGNRETKLVAGMRMLG